MKTLEGRVDKDGRSLTDDAIIVTSKWMVTSRDVMLQNPNLKFNRCFTRTRNAAHTRGMLFTGIRNSSDFRTNWTFMGLWLLDVNYEHFDACVSDAGRRLHLSYWSLTYISKNDNMHAKRVRRYKNSHQYMSASFRSLFI